MKLVNLTCPNCGAQLKRIGDNLCCDSCGGAFAIDYDDADVEHEKLQTEDERAAREFEHEKELLEIKHRQMEQSRLAAEKREYSRKRSERVGRAISAKISALIGLAIFFGFIFGGYQLGVHYGLTPPLKELIEAEAVVIPKFDFEASAISDEVNENLIEAGKTFIENRDNVNDYKNGEWIDYTFQGAEFDSAYFIRNVKKTNRYVVIYKLKYTSESGDKETYDACYFSDLRLENGNVISDYRAQKVYKSDSAWHGSFEDRNQCYRESVLSEGGTVTEIKK